jgi:hypothetical protein
MSPETDTTSDVRVEAQRLISEMRSSVESGDQHWFHALLHAVRNWPLSGETKDERDFHYLVGGEAFDWLLLAERLCDEMADLIPEDEAEALLFHERLPLHTDEADFEALLGAKYKPHLNFVYGVRVEAALQVAVQEEVRKELAATRVWDNNGHVEDEAFQRIYGKPSTELLAEFRASAGAGSEWLSLAELSEWRYWLFRYRVKNCDPAKVASDTRKGLLMLQTLDRAARQRSSAPA